MNQERLNVISFPISEKPIIIGNNALKAGYWENLVPISAQTIDLERYRNNPLKEQIAYLDAHYIQEDLPRDWKKIGNIGFSSDRQMKRFREEEDINKWAEQTGQDLLGFGLEYLRQGTVFPFEYQIEGSELVDNKYGGRRMVDTVDPKERGGAVLDSLYRIQEHLLNGEDGATGIMVSRPGYTDLKMDDGSNIVYTDTMVFHLQKKGDKVIGTTIRTDMTVIQAEALIEQLTGQELPSNATAADCTRALTLLDGIDGESSKGVEALVDVLQKIKGSEFSYQDRTWNSTKLDIKRRNELYYFDQITHVMIDDFKEYVTRNNLSEEDTQKALAATFLRISKHLLVDKSEFENNVQSNIPSVGSYRTKPVTMGAVLKKVIALPGCMGGGRIVSVDSMTPRSAVVEEDWSDKSKRKYDKAGPCNTCGRDVPCGPCHMCQSCNEFADINEQAA